MKFEQKIIDLENISIKRLKEKIAHIRTELPKEQQKVISFSRNFTLSLSNYCQNQCGYCFYNHKISKKTKDKNVVLIKEDKINELIQKALMYGCSEVLIMSGDTPDSYEVVQKELERRKFNNFLQFVKQLSERLLELNLLPHTNIGVLSFDQLKCLK